METANFPFRKARLYVPSPHAKRREWYIQYWAWDILKKKLKKFSDFEVNSIKGDDNFKKKWAKRRCLQINNMLEQGYHYNPTKQHFIKHQETFSKQKSSLPIQNLLQQFYIQVEKRGLEKHELKTNHHLNGYKSKGIKFLDWLNQNHIVGLTADLISKDHINNFLEHLINDLDLSMRTRDNYLNFIRAFFIWCTNEQIPNQNPCKGITKKNRKLGRNIAYTKEQQTELLQWMKTERPDFYFLCLWIYFTFIRIEELALLRIEHINQFQEGVIRIPEEISKNGYLRNVTIPTQLQIEIEKQELKKFPKHYFIFSKGLVPGETHYNPKYIGNNYGKVLKRRFKWLTNDYTLYSWKHTGIVELKKAGIEDAYIMTQSGHRTITSYQTYLKSLGIARNDVIVNSFPSPGV